ncbi:MAG TPA: MFS transporter [Candidatus Limnocylindrales bacterium]|nr:MFS transporter [Candidatus Limnocylindrales bacterium]
MKLSNTFWRLWLSTASSNLSDGIGKTAFPLLAAAITRDPVQVSLLTTAFFLPWLLFALPSGAVVDRVDRSRAMAIANAVRAVIVGVLAVSVITGWASMPLLYLAAFSLGAAETISDSAYRAVLPALVAREDLDRGNGYLQGTELVADAFLGAPIASASFALAAGSPFVMGAAGFALSAVVAGTLPPTAPDRGADAKTGLGAIRGEIAAGVRWLAAHPTLRWIMVMGAAMGLVGAGYNSIAVLYALDVLGVPTGLFGVLILTLAVGGVIGSVTATTVSRRLGRGRALQLAVFVGALAFLGLGTVRDAALAGVLLAISSWSVIVWNVLTMSLRQQLIPEAMFGRVQGAWRTAVWGAMPLGAALGGVVAGTFGLAAPFTLAGLGHIVVLVLGWRLLARAGRATTEAAA